MLFPIISSSSSTRAPVLKQLKMDKAVFPSDLRKRVNLLVRATPSFSSRGTPFLDCKKRVHKKHLTILMLFSPRKPDRRSVMRCSLPESSYRNEAASLWSVIFFPLKAYHLTLQGVFWNRRGSKLTS